MRCLAIAISLLFCASSLMAQRFVKTFETVAAMVAANPNDVNTNAWVAGYRSVNDGGEGPFTYDKNSAITTNLGTVFKPTSFAGRWLRPTNGIINVRQFGAWGNGVTDSLAAFNSAVADCPVGGTLYIPPGTYLLSNTLTIPKPISIKGAGNAMAQTSIISPGPTFPAGADFITITGGYSTVSDICSLMNRRGGNWLTFIGEGSDNVVYGNRVQGVASNYWGIELRDPLGVNGVCCSQIDANFFYDFDGGAIWGNGGGDSVNITRNVFQLVNSTSHILKWHSIGGASNCKFSANNGSGARHFIELGLATAFNITQNQLEATTGISNAASAMIVVNGPSFGLSIRDNTLHGHSNCTNAIYLNDSQDIYIDNNTIYDVATSIKTTTNTARVTFLKGYTIGVLNDTNNVVSTIHGSSNSVFQGNIRVGSSNLWSLLEISNGTNQSVLLGNQSTNLGNGVFTNVTSGIAFRRQSDGIPANGIFNYEDGIFPGLGVQARSDITFLNNGVPTVTIDELGTVAIGTNTANQKLFVNGNIGIQTNGYLNFDAVDGTAGYGFRNDNGTMQLKNSGGAWANIGGGGSGTVTHTAGALTLDLPVFGNGASDLKVGTKSGTGTELPTTQSPTIVTPTILQIPSSLNVVGLLSNATLTASRLVATDANKALSSTISSANAALSATDETGTGNWVFSDGATMNDLIVGGSFQLPNGAAPTTDVFGEIAGDNNAWAAGRGTVQLFDGTANAYVVAALASDVPSNGQVPTWNTGGTVTWETPSAGGAVPISDLIDATAQNTLFFGDFGQDWVIGLTNTTYGLRFTEVAGGVAGGTMMKFEQLAGTRMNAIQVTRLTTNIFTVSTNGVRFGVVAEFVEATGYTANTPAIFDADTNLVSGAQSGTGSIYLAQGSPTITTPTIASFVNSTHTHQAASGGGQLVFTNATFSNLDLLNVVANDVLTYHGGGVWTNKVSSGGTPGYVLNINKQLSGNPVDGTTFYIGGGVSSFFNATEANEVITIPRTGTLKRVDIALSCGTPGSGESVGHYFRLNSTTDTTLTTTATWDAAYETHSHTGLSTAVTAGDTFTLKFVAPTWVTNPATVRIYANLYFE